MRPNLENSLIRAIIAVLGFIALFLFGRNYLGPSCEACPSREIKDYVGMTENAAKLAIKKKGLVPRVTERDGQSFPITMDYRTDRVNLIIENGTVVRAYIG